MVDFLGIPVQALMGQLMIGLVTGSFYAMLGLGLAVIFGLLHVINFAHGAFYMLGAYLAWLLGTSFGVNFWTALILVPLIVGACGMVFEKLLITRLYGRDPLYSLLMTLGVAMMLEYALLWRHGSAGMSYAAPEALRGGVNLGFMFLPLYRGWIVIASLLLCLAVWWLVHRTSFGARLRAATEQAALTQTFGINVPLLKTVTFGLGTALAAVAGVLAAPVFQVSPVMGQSLLIPVFAVVVIGGMGSIHGVVAAGYLIGLSEGVMRIVFPEAAALTVYLVMVLVILLRPAERRRVY